MKDPTIRKLEEPTPCCHCMMLISKGEVKLEEYVIHRSNDVSKYFHQDCFLDWMRQHYKM